jgi:hypothetical protein
MGDYRQMRMMASRASRATVSALDNLLEFKLNPLGSWKTDNGSNSKYFRKLGTGIRRHDFQD